MDTDRDFILDTALKAAISGATFGAPLGVASRLWMGGRKISDLIRAALVGGGLGAGVSGGTGALGSAVLGEPGHGEANPYLARGGAGGALAGGGLGGVLGGLAAAGKFPRPLPASLLRVLPRPNIVTDKISSFIGQPGAVKKGAGLGAAALGIPAAIYGADEGTGLDALAREIEKERLRRQLMESYG